MKMFGGKPGAALGRHLAAGLLALGCAQGAHAEAALRLTFDATPLEIVLQDYGEKTARTLLLAPNLPDASITLRSHDRLTEREYLNAIEAVLSMHGVALVPEGDAFVRVISAQGARQHPLAIREDDDRDDLEDSGRLISQLIGLQHIAIEEADQAVKALLRSDYGQVDRFERINSILVTDTEANIRRVLQMIRHLDAPVPIREEPNVMRIRYARASEIKAKLEEVIAEAREQQQRTVTVARPARSGAPRMERVESERAPTVPGVIRPPRPRRNDADATVAETMEEVVELAERGIIQGRVHIVADDRTNILILITRPENMSFFERIVDVLDVETAPDFITEVVSLEHADAEAVASSLNTLIASGGSGAGAASALARSGAADAEDRAAALRDYVDQLQRAVPGEPGVSRVGQLSDQNIKILPDPRANSLLIMASKGDMEALKGIIQSMDIRLSQVLIEAVIMEVQLSDSVQTGMDWVQQAMTQYAVRGDGARTARFAFAGSGGSGDNVPRDVATFAERPPAHRGGLTYYFTHFGLNLDTLLRMSASDANTRIVSSPVIVTHDNTEASIDSAVERYFLSGRSWVGTALDGRWEDDVAVRKVGLHLKVTPRINQERFVVMDILQRIEELGVPQTIDDTEWPTVLSRELSASVAVQDGETIVLGGLVQQQNQKVRRGVPFLYKLPLVGSVFGFQRTEESQSEIIVFITPHVLDTEQEIERESRRRRESGELRDLWPRSWTGPDSIRDPVPPEEAEERTEFSP